jgi:hypothetical protein
LDYGEAEKWFLEPELIASYTDIVSYVSIALTASEFLWSGWKLWSSFASKFYFFDLGSYLGRLIANLYAIIDYGINFNTIVAERRVRNTIWMHGNTTPTGKDKEIVIIEVNKPLTPEDDVLPDDQNF